MKLSKHKIINIFIIIVFFAILLAPTIYTEFDLKTPYIINENRELQKAPIFTLKNINKYPKEFEEFYSDNYGFRQELLLINKRVLDDWLNVSISTKVLLGKNNWLYTTEYGALKDYQGVLKYNPEILKKLLDLLISEYREAKKNGIKYVFLVVPDKHTIYPEYLPDAIQENKIHGHTLLDQLTEELKKIEQDFPILDLRQALWDAKKENIIYWQLDSHWNELGAYYGYRAIAEYLGIKPIPLRNFKVKERPKNSGNLAEMIYKKIEYIDYYLDYKTPPNFYLVKEDKSQKNIFRETWELPLDKETGRRSYYEYRNPKQSLNLLVFRDSFSDDLRKFLPNHFYRSSFIWLYPCEIKFDLAKKQGINIIIREVAETRTGLQISRCE
jgi:alginate O-acetyltransferase complex protein AlgJ